MKDVARVGDSFVTNDVIRQCLNVEVCYYEILSKSLKRVGFSRPIESPATALFRKPAFD